MNLIFLSFSNSEKSPLPTLQEEDKELYRTLSRREAKQHFRLHRDSNATIETTDEYVVLHQDEIILFHYSGHAEKDKLILGDQSANSDGIAYLLGRCPKLKAVILNGCSTKSQVAALRRNGIPVVIATSAAIGDRKATQFSITFFQALADGRKTIREAFENGIGAAQTQSQNDLNVERNRGGFDVDAADFEEPLWGIYYRDEKDLEWRLPSSSNQFHYSSIKTIGVFFKELIPSFFGRAPKDLRTSLTFAGIAAVGSFFMNALMQNVSITDGPVWIVISLFTILSIALGLSLLFILTSSYRSVFFKGGRTDLTAPPSKQFFKRVYERVFKKYNDERRAAIKVAIRKNWTLLVAGLLVAITFGWCWIQFFESIQHDVYARKENIIESESSIHQNYERATDGSQFYWVILKQVKEKGEMANKMNFPEHLLSDLIKEKNRLGLPIRVWPELPVINWPDELTEDQIDSLGAKAKGVYVISGYYDDFVAELKVEDRSRNNGTIRLLTSVFGMIGVNQDSLLKYSSSKGEMEPLMHKVEREFDQDLTKEYMLRYGIPKEIRFFVMKMIGDFMLHETSDFYSKNVDNYAAERQIENLLQFTLAIHKAAEKNLEYEIDWFGFSPLPVRRLNASNLYQNLFALYNLMTTNRMKEAYKGNKLSREKISSARLYNDKANRYFQKRFALRNSNEENKELQNLVDLTSSFQCRLAKQYIQLLLLQDDYTKASEAVLKSSANSNGTKKGTGTGLTLTQKYYFFRMQSVAKKLRNTTRQMYNLCDNYSKKFEISQKKVIAQNTNIIVSLTMIGFQVNKKKMEELKSALKQSEKILKAQESIINLIR